MAGIVVGTISPTASSGAAVRWACDEAVLRNLPLHLVHAWDSPLKISMSIGGDHLSGMPAAVTVHAVKGSPVRALLSLAPDLLVLGRRAGGRHLSRTGCACVAGADCPVVIVPDHVPPRTGRVIVGVRCNDNSRNTLRWAAEEALHRGSRLVVIHAWQVRPTSTRDLLRPSRAIPGQRQAVRDRLGNWAGNGVGGVDAEFDAAHGSPLDTLLHAGAAGDIIVLGRSARAGIGKVVHAAVDRDLMSLAPCPIAVIPPRRVPDTTPPPTG